MKSFWNLAINRENTSRSCSTPICSHLHNWDAFTMGEYELADDGRLVTVARINQLPCLARSPKPLLTDPEGSATE